MLHSFIIFIWIHKLFGKLFPFLNEESSFLGWRVSSIRIWISCIRLLILVKRVIWDATFLRRLQILILIQNTFYFDKVFLISDVDMMATTHWVIVFSLPRRPRAFVCLLDLPFWPLELILKHVVIKVFSCRRWHVLSPIIRSQIYKTACFHAVYDWIDRYKLWHLFFQLLISKYLSKIVHNLV